MAGLLKFAPSPFAVTRNPQDFEFNNFVQSIGCEGRFGEPEPAMVESAIVVLVYSAVLTQMGCDFPITHTYTHTPSFSWSMIRAGWQLSRYVCRESMKTS